MREPIIPYDRVLNRLMPKTAEEQEVDELFYEFKMCIKTRLSDTYVTPPAVIAVNETVIATEGNFSASVGKPKSRKTYNVCALTAAMLSGNKVLGYETCMPEGKTKVLYADTEQSHIHCYKVLNRIYKMTGLTPEEVDMRLDLLMLREFSPKERRDIIDKTLATDPTIGFVVIDSIRDLIRDINSPNESTNIINDLMRWTQMYHIHVHTVLHLNKTDDQVRDYPNV
jgi:RecA-family ATPase